MNNLIFLVALIPLLLVGPTLSFAALNNTDCKIAGSNPPRYNTTCEGLNTKAWNNTFAEYDNMTKNIIGNMTN